MRRTAFLAAIALCVLVPASQSAAQSADDKAMAQTIGSQLKESGQLHDYRVGVKYHDGVAVLNGSVANDRQLATAIGLTQHMEGVDRVVNHLTIANTASAGAGSGQLELGSSLGHASQLSAKYPRQQAEQAYAPASQMAGPANQMAAQGPARPPQRRSNMPLPMGRMPVQQASAEMPGPMQASCMGCGPGGPGGPGMGPGGPMGGGGPAPAGYVPGGGGGVRGASYDNAQMPGYAWPSYAAYPNYAAVTYPQQYSPSAWPYIGPFYPYPQVPLGWRKVALEWDDGWWFLDFSDSGANH